jgi:RNA polymerase sigma-70 factor (ECF subfamily)
MESELGATAGKAEKDVALVARIRAGDPLAEDEFVMAFRRPVLLIAAERTRDREAAKDLAQETLIAVLKALREGHLREVEKLAAFVYGTARNVINNYLRVKGKRRECDIHSVQEPSTDPVKELELTEQKRLIKRELESYNAVDQQILLLSLVDGHSLLEVAKRLEMSHEAVRARRSRMVRKLTKKFGHMSQQ